MSRTIHIFLLLTGVIGLFVTCRKESPEPTPPVTEPPDTPAGVQFDPAAGPHPDLADYGFFHGPLHLLQPVDEVLPYDLISPLFTDYALKQRHVWMPEGVKATWDGNDGVLQFPEGAVLLKTFYYDQVQPGNVRRLIETRMMYRWEGVWHFANYVWNDAQTEALLYDTNGSFTEVDWMDEDGLIHHVDYRIPAESECGACHKEYGIHSPIGPRPRNLASMYPYADGLAPQLEKWVAQGLLEGGHPPAEPMGAWKDEQADLQERVRAYLDINCGHCHSASGYCNYRPMRFGWEETTDPANLGICVEPHEAIPGLTHIVAASRPDRSVISHRLASTEPSMRMPLLGRTVVHEEALTLIDTWIELLTPPCE